MRPTRRNFFKSTAGGLLLAGGSVLCTRRLQADDPSPSVDDALASFINLWNQFGSSDSPDFGTNWIADPAVLALLSSAYDALSNAWAMDGADSQVQNAFDSGGFNTSTLQFEVPQQAYLELMRHGANFRFSDVLNWFTNPSIDWQSAMNELSNAPLSGLVQSLGQAVNNSADIGRLGSAVLLGAVLADSQFSRLESRSPTTAAGALAFELAIMAIAPS